METNNKKIILFLKNVSRLLKEHDLDEIINVISVSATSKDSTLMQQRKELDFILNKTCELWGVSPKMLKSQCKGDAYEAKKCVYFLAKNSIGMKPAIIAKEFSQNRVSVHNAIKQVYEMNYEKIPADRKFKEKMDVVFKAYHELINKK